MRATLAINWSIDITNLFIFQTSLSVSHRNVGYFCKCFVGLKPVAIYLFIVDNGNTRKVCEICSKLTIETPERRKWGRSGISSANFEQYLYLVLLSLLLTLNKLRNHCK